MTSDQPGKQVQAVSDGGAAKARGYKDLLVWQKGMALVKHIYRITQGFPGEEKFGLTSQLRRAAISIPSNIAEGQARHTTREFIQFVSNAEGSVAELDTQFMLGMDLGYCSSLETAEAFQLIIELRRMLNALRRKLTSSQQ